MKYRGKRCIVVLERTIVKKLGNLVHLPLWGNVFDADFRQRQDKWHHELVQ